MTKKIGYPELNKWVCGNCGPCVINRPECPITHRGVDLGNYGCLVGLDHFSDRGYLLTPDLEFVLESELHTIFTQGIPILSTNRLLLGLESPNSISKMILPLGDFNFALTKEVLNHPELVDYYRKSNKYCILDNSTNEELKPCSLKEISVASGLINPDLIVAPDYLGDSKKTLGILRNTIDLFGRTGVLPVLQGSSFEEIISCAESIRNHNLNIIAVPYDLISGRTAPVWTMARIRSLIVYYLVNILGFKDIHLLGLTSVEEFQYYNHSPITKQGIRSVDTGGPVLLGLKGLRYPTELSLKTTPTLKLMNQQEDIEHKNLSNAIWNIAYLRTLL